MANTLTPRELIAAANYLDANGIDSDAFLTNGVLGSSTADQLDALVVAAVAIGWDAHPDDARRARLDYLLGGF